MATPAVTAWDENGNPVQPAQPAATGVTAWDENGNPIQPQQQAQGDYLSKTEDVIHRGSAALAQDVGGAAKGIWDMATAPAQHLHAAIKSLVNRDYVAAGTSFLQSLASDPGSQIADAQLKSSYEAGQRMIESAKKGDVLGVAQHQAGLIPGASQVDAAMTRYQEDHSVENLVHVMTTALPILIPGMLKLKGAGAAEETATSAEVAPKAAPKTGASPIEEVVSKGAARSGLPEGSAASTAPLGEEIQPTLQKNLRTTMGNVAKQAEVKAPQSSSVRDIAKDTAAQIESKAKVLYRQLDEASGGRWQRFDDQLKNIRKEMRNTFGIDDDAYDALELKANEIETTRDFLIDELETQGKIAPKMAQQAKAYWKQSQALYDLDQQIKNSTSGMRPGIGHSGSSAETVDPAKLSTRLNKLYDKGRLQEAAGEKGARDFLTHSDNAQTAAQEIKEFVPSSPTGQTALRELLTKSTEAKSSLLKGGKVTAKIDWNKAVSNFEKLTPEQQQAIGNPAEVRQYLGRQALKQNSLHILKRGAQAGAAYVGARKAYDVVSGDH